MDIEKQEPNVKPLTREDVMLALVNLKAELLLGMQGEPQEKINQVLRAVEEDYLRFAATKPSRYDKPELPTNTNPTD